MKPQEQKRKVIQKLYAAGNNDKDIIVATKYPSNTVYRVVKRLKAGEGIKNKLCGPSEKKSGHRPFWLASRDPLRQTRPSPWGCWPPDGA